MPFAAAYLRLRLISADGLDLPGLRGAAIGATDRAYFVARIGGRFIGRSPRVAANAHSFDFTAARDAGGWARSLAVDFGATVTIQLDLYLDTVAEAAPVLLGSVVEDIVVPAGVDAEEGLFETVKWRSGPGAQRIIAGFVPFTFTYEAIVEKTPRTIVLPPDLARSAFELANANALVALPIVQVRFFNVEGLYQPVTPAPRDDRPLSRAVDGYTSADDRGRIFSNHTAAGAWSAGQQYIDLTVRLDAHLVDLSVTALEVRWTMLVPDDPSDDAPTIHRVAGAILDPTDYGVSADADATPQHLGAQRNDNHSTAAHNPPWAQTYYAVRNATGTTVISRVGQLGVDEDFQPTYGSAVRLHCPSTGGDRLVVRVEVETVLANGGVAIPAETGIMTVWKRIVVDYIRLMARHPSLDALALPVDRIGRHFEPAFVEMRFSPVTAIADARAGEYMSTDDAHLSADCDNFLQVTFDPVPDHFCLVAAKSPYQLVPVPAAEIYRGANIPIQRWNQFEYLEIPQNLAAPLFSGPVAAAGVFLYWQVVGVNHSMYFNVHSEQTVAMTGVRRIFLFGHDLQDQFTGHDADGTIAHAYNDTRNYFPRGRHQGGWAGNGYGMPAQVNVVVLGAGASITSGISPETNGHFDGRTLVFTHHPGYMSALGVKTPGADDAMEQTIVHELCHAFGMPHKCGKWEPTKPRARTCAMNYDNHWMTEDNTLELVPATNGRLGPALCARHLRELRRVLLQNNPELGW